VPLARTDTAPLLAGPPVVLCSHKLANSPASVGVANSTAGGSYNNRWDYRYAWHYRYTWHCWSPAVVSAAIVHAAVVAVATAAAIGAAVKAGSTATGDRNCQTGLYLFERCERYGRRGSNAEETDADGDSESKSFVIHSSLLLRDVNPDRTILAGRGVSYGAS
jgi:hypothetical protein